MELLDLSSSEFIQKINEIATVEEKLRLAIAYMKQCLTREKSPDFKGFWEIRKLALDLFKEPINPLLRRDLWAEYVELTREGRRLKDLLDEEASFILSQIEIAINAVAEEIKGFQENNPKVLSKAVKPTLPENCRTLEKRASYFIETQTKINILTTFATRIQGLRNEVAKCSIRIKQKTLFFDKLSKLGDDVFPQKREFIQEISQNFFELVQAFIESNFSEKEFTSEKVRKRTFGLREEIKGLQSAAKILTLNTETFTSTREELSKCWDKLKAVQQELKQEFAEEKQKSLENVEPLNAKMSELETSFKGDSISLQEFEQKVEELNRSIRSLELTSSDVRMLKDKIRALKSLSEAKRNEEEAHRKVKEEAIERKRVDALEEWKSNATSYKSLDLSIEELEEKNKMLKEILSHLSLNKWEKQSCDRILKEIRDLIEEKKEKKVIALSDDEKASLQELNDLLQQKKLRRSEIKAAIEEYRKVIGGSSLSFEKAMEYNELMRNEKERLEKMDDAIAEIEKRVTQLKRLAK